MTKNQGVAALPESLRGYFWDYDGDSLSGESSRHTIVLRLLQSGGMDAIWWLRASIGDEALRDFIMRRRGRGIEPRRLRFWSVVLDIPNDQVDEWVAAARSDPWS